VLFSFHPIDHLFVIGESHGEDCFPVVNEASARSGIPFAEEHLRTLGFWVP